MSRAGAALCRLEGKLGGDVVTGDEERRNDGDEHDEVARRRDAMEWKHRNDGPSFLNLYTHKCFSLCSFTHGLNLIRKCTQNFFFFKKML